MKKQVLFNNIYYSPLVMFRYITPIKIIEEDNDKHYSNTINIL